MTVKKRLTAYLAEKKIKHSDFCTSIGVSGGFISAMRTSIQPDKIKSIALIYPDVNIEWLLTGVGEMLNKYVYEEKKMSEAIGIFNPERKGIPLIPVEAIAGFVGGDVPGIRIEDCDFYRVPEFEKLKADFSIRIKGDSMVPKFQNNDVIACRYIKDITFFQWGMVYLLDTCQGPLVKRIYKHDSEDFIICQSENREVYPPFDLQKTEIRSVSIVLGIIRVEMI